MKGALSTDIYRVSGTGDLTATGYKSLKGWLCLSIPALSSSTLSCTGGRKKPHSSFFPSSPEQTDLGKHY